MDLTEFKSQLNSQKVIKAGSSIHQYMFQLNIQARRITCTLNNSYQSPDQIRALFSELIGTQVDETFNMFPPFYTDCGKNIMIGKNVFINSGCHFQDQGGISIGDGCLIGHNVTLTTLNHGIPADQRNDLYPSPINIGENVWIGASATILPGITIGDNAIVGAGSVVTKNIPSNTLVAGVPARIIKNI